MSRSIFEKLISFIRIGLFLSLLVVNSAWSAGPRDLILKPYRPTLQEFLSNVDLKAENPFQPYIPEDPRLAAVKKGAPELIAQLEYAFPGKIWAVLGTDTTYVEIILSLYGELVGEQSRVVRLDASWLTCRSPEDSIKLLSSAGLTRGDGSHLKDFIILGVTQWLNQKRSKENPVRRLIQTFYEKQVQFGDDPTTYYDRVNAVALIPEYINRDQVAQFTQLVPIHSGLNIYRFLHEGPSIDRVHEKVLNPIVPSKILAIMNPFSNLYPKEQNTFDPQNDEELFNFNLKSNEITWHKKFLELYEPYHGAADEKVYARPGDLKKEEYREHILWFMFEAAKIILTEDFYRSVVEKGQQYGVDLRNSRLEYLHSSHADFLNWVKSNQRKFRRGLPSLVKTQLKTLSNWVVRQKEVDFSLLYKLLEIQSAFSLDLITGTQIRDQLVRPDAEYSSHDLLQFLKGARLESLGEREEVLNALFSHCQDALTFSVLVDWLEERGFEASQKVAPKYILSSVRFSFIENRWNEQSLKKFIDLLPIESCFSFVRAHTRHILTSLKNLDYYFYLIVLFIERINQASPPLSEKVSMGYFNDLEGLIKSQSSELSALRPSSEQMSYLENMTQFLGKKYFPSSKTEIKKLLSGHLDKPDKIRRSYVSF